jgi:uncharacterized protein DUF4232
MTKLVVSALLVLAALSASSAPAGGPILCSARTLSARGALQGAAGTLEGGVTVTNRRPYPCTLSGRPSVLFVHGGSGLSVKRLPGVSTTGGRDLRPFTILSGQKAFVRLRWSNWCGKRYSYVGLLVSLKSRQPRLIVDGTAPTPPCVKRTAPSVVAIGPWEH